MMIAWELFWNWSLHKALGNYTIVSFSRLSSTVVLSNIKPTSYTISFYIDRTRIVGFSCFYSSYLLVLWKHFIFFLLLQSSKCASILWCVEENTLHLISGICYMKRRNKNIMLKMSSNNRQKTCCDSLFINGIADNVCFCFYFSSIGIHCIMWKSREFLYACVLYFFPIHHFYFFINQIFFQILRMLVNRNAFYLCLEFIVFTIKVMLCFIDAKFSFRIMWKEKEKWMF